MKLYLLVQSFSKKAAKQLICDINKFQLSYKYELQYFIRTIKLPTKTLVRTILTSPNADKASAQEALGFNSYSSIFFISLKNLNMFLSFLNSIKMYNAKIALNIFN